MAIFSKKKTDKEEKKISKTDDVKIAKKEDKKDVKENKDVKKDKKSKETKVHGIAYKHIIRPVISEKASLLGMDNQYVFEVSTKANKSEIRKAITSLYGVTPIKINIINVRGKSVRYGRTFGTTKAWKKAMITLKEGDKIEVYEGV